MDASSSTFLSPADITLDALKSGALSAQFPQFYALKEVEENSVAHNHQLVFDHVILVLEALEKLLTLEFVQELALKQKLQAYLDQRHETVDRRTLLFLGTVFHDIGKAETLVEVEDGVMACPAHELIGAGIAAQCVEKIDLSPQERAWIVQFVRLHGYVHALIDIRLKRTDRDFFAPFQAAVGDMDAGLLLFVWADLLGSDFPAAAPDKYALREQAVRDMIGWL